MYIHEAIKQAMPLGKSIRRRCDFWVNQRITVIPTNTVDCMILSNSGRPLFPRWNPKAEDLTADDWEVLPG